MLTKYDSTLTIIQPSCLACRYPILKNDFDGNIFKPAMFVNVMIENYIAHLYSVRNTIIFAGSMNLCKFKAWCEKP